MPPVNNRELYEKLRKEFPLFNYNSYNFTLGDRYINLEFEFELSPELIFRPRSRIIIPQNLPFFKDHQLVDNIVFNIGLIELISYWKATCSPTIKIKAGSLTNSQVQWWKKLYYHGLGEFLYLNSLKVSPDELMSIQSVGEIHKLTTADLTDDYIVPVGGGKDSAVTLELLNSNGFKASPLIMNPRGATIETVTAAGLPTNEIIVIERSIDPLLLDLNAKGFLNGHTPFSAMLAFYSLAVAALTGIKNIALSNESSANEATIPGTGINHQYSKSFEFEKDFRNYYKEFISPGINYFSFLRPLSELQIMSLFSDMTKYHSVFKSCNVGSKINEWCGSCPKCLFTHIMLSAFKGVDYADKIIGKPMLNEIGNKNHFEELSGISDIKPFECVGTINDVNKALRMIIENSGDSLPLLVELYKKHAQYNNVDLTEESTTHFLNSTQWEIIKKALN